MNRRTFLGGIVPTMLVPVRGAFAQERPATPGWITSAAGQPVNLARYGDAKSWLNPEAAKALASRVWLDDNPETSLSLADVTSNNADVDVGVEWPEFRTVDKIVIRYAPGKAPGHGHQFVEHWSGLTALQGDWKPLEDGSTNAAFLRTERDTWTYGFARMRTCKVRLRLHDARNVAIEQFSVFGPSRWKTGEVRIELGHLGTDKPLDGRVELYNAELLDFGALSGAEVRDGNSWTARGGRGKIARLRARILYTHGADVDRSIVTIRHASGDVSFLPALAVDNRPIDIPDFGVYVCNESKPVERQVFLRSNEGRHRIIDEVGRMPEQTLEQAYANIQSHRVTLSFVGVDSNNHKFGIAPDGHIVVGTHDPSAGQVMVPVFASYFDTTEEPLWFQPAAPPRRMAAHSNNGLEPERDRLRAHRLCAPPRRDGREPSGIEWRRARRPDIVVAHHEQLRHRQDRALFHPALEAGDWRPGLWDHSRGCIECMGHFAPGQCHHGTGRGRSVCFLLCRRAWKREIESSSGAQRGPVFGGTGAG
jgi:hypothetical protein